MRKHLVIGTRGSQLALIQTELVAAALRQLDPDMHIQTKIITTKGDTNQMPIPLDTVGKAWFTAEIAQALRTKDIDMATHSLKDLPPDPGVELISLPVLKRADPRDVLVSKTGVVLSKLESGSVIGTDSLRRKAALLLARPDLRVKSIRGNVQTRLRKLHEQDYDGVVLAAAGLKRLGQQDIITEFLDPARFVPAGGQGVLAAQVRRSDHDLRDLLIQIQDTQTLVAVEAELAFSRVVGGGCKLPVACYARVTGETVDIFAMLGDSTGHKAELASSRGDITLATTIAEQLAVKLTAGKALA